MYPPFFDTCKADATVRSLFGQSPRIFPHGVADQGTDKPYAVFQMISGTPENYLGDRPDVDTFDLQVDVYASKVEDAAAGARAIRDAIEPVAFITGWRGQFKDFDTGLYRYSFDVSFITPRT